MSNLSFIDLWRRKRGLTQEELAKLIDVSLPTLSRWENQQTEPRASDIKALCEVLQVTESELLNGPKIDELKINIIWEVEEEMNGLCMNANEFNVGFRSDEQYLLWGALPFSMKKEEILERIGKELDVALEMRELREKRMKGQMRKEGWA